MANENLVEAHKENDALKEVVDALKAERQRFLAECWERGEAPSDEAWTNHLRRAAYVTLLLTHTLLRFAGGPERSMADAENEAAEEIITLVTRYPFYNTPPPWIPDEVRAACEDDFDWIFSALQAREDELQAMSYADYLITPEWAEQRRGALRRAQGRCQTCGGAGRLHVHHRSYGRRGAEAVDDLVVLCEDCHLAVHTRGGSHRPRNLRPA
jgi:hypothetical protein